MTEDSKTRASQKVQFTVSAVDGVEHKSYVVQNAWTVDHLNVPSQRLRKSIMANNSQLHELKIDDIDAADVGLLIGSNVPEAALGGEKVYIWQHCPRENTVGMDDNAGIKNASLQTRTHCTTTHENDQLRH